MHMRRVIKQAVVNILLGRTLAAVTGGNPLGDPTVYPIPEAGKKVFPNRSTPLWPQEVKDTVSICVFLTEETADNSRSGNGKFLDRVPKIKVELATAAVQGFDDKLDDAAEKVEALLLTRRQIFDPLDSTKAILALLNVNGHGLKRSDLAIVTENVDTPTGVLSLEFEFKWEYKVPIPEAVEALAKVGFQISAKDVGLPQAQIESLTTIES